MTEDHLVATVSLPMWFPPVTINGDTYFDAVFITDANLEEAVRQGADEIWAIWTVSRRNEWRDGFVAQYFQIIETVADTNFFTFWKRLEKNNADIAAGQPGEFGRSHRPQSDRGRSPRALPAQLLPRSDGRSRQCRRRGRARVVPRRTASR